MYDVIIIGAGPGGIFSAYELMKQDENLKIAVFDAGHSLEQRHCPIDGEKVKSCIGCKTCAIMNGFGGAGAKRDITQIRFADLWDTYHCGLSILTVLLKNALI